MQNWKNQKHSSDPKTSKIRTMFLEMQNSSLGGRFGFLLTKLIQFCHTFYQFFNQFFADFEYHTRATDQICAYLKKISDLVGMCCHLNIREAVCLSIYLFVWSHQSKLRCHTQQGEPDISTAVPIAVSHCSPLSHTFTGVLRIKVLIFLVHLLLSDDFYGCLLFVRCFGRISYYCRCGLVSQA